MLSNSSREGYADDWEADRGEVKRPHHAKPYDVTGAGLPTAANLNTQQIPPKRYKTPGVRAEIPRHDLELSKIEKQVEDIRAILKQSRAQSSLPVSEIKTALFKIELSTSYLKEHSHG